MRAFVLIITGIVGSLKSKMAVRVGIAVTFQILFGWYSVRLSTEPLTILTEVSFLIFGPGTGSSQPREQFEELLGRNSSGSGPRKSKLRSEGLVALTT
jgi:hypothetical protein